MTQAFNLVVLILFWLMLACNSVVAGLYGQRVEKAFAALLLGASLLTLFVSRTHAVPEAGLNLAQALDWAILVVAWFLALRSDRYWPIWFAAMQSLSIITGAVAGLVNGVPHLVFSNMAAAWSLPALVTMSWGVMHDHATWRAVPPMAPMPRSAPGAR